VTDGVYAALARPQVMTNCNAAIFVNSADVVVVDAHSKPSAAAALIAQIKKEVTAKPVRYLVNTHFHWDHTQGDAAYKASGAKVDIIASDTTKQLMTQLSRNRLKESLDGVPKQIDDVQALLASREDTLFHHGSTRHLFPRNPTSGQRYMHRVYRHRKKPRAQDRTRNVQSPRCFWLVSGSSSNPVRCYEDKSWPDPAEPESPESGLSIRDCVRDEGLHDSR